MKILLLGSGGREHALAWKIAQSKKVDQLYVAPGNAGTGGVGENVPLKADDFEGIRQFVLSKGVDMVVVNTPMQDTVSPVCEWLTSRTTAQRKMIQLMIKPLLSVIASEGSGRVDGSILPAFSVSSLRKTK